MTQGSRIEITMLFMDLYGRSEKASSRLFNSVPRGLLLKGKRHQE